MKNCREILVVITCILTCITNGFILRYIVDSNKELKIRNTISDKLNKNYQNLSKNVKQVRLKVLNSQLAIASMFKKINEKIEQRTIKKSHVQVVNCLQVENEKLANLKNPLENGEVHCLEYKVDKTVKNLLVQGCNNEKKNKYRYVLNSIYNICTSKEQLKRHRNKKGFVHFDKNGKLFKQLRSFINTTSLSILLLEDLNSQKEYAKKEFAMLTQ